MSRSQAARTPAARTRHGSVSRALARDRLGVPAVLFFVLAGVAPLTVAAGVIPTAYQATGLTGIPAAFVVVAVILAVFATGYMAMSRRITHSGAFYAFVARGLGRPAGVAAALVALVAYTFLQVGLYGALGPAAAAEGAAHLRIHQAWWVWALIAWAVITFLGQLRVDITGKVLGVLLSAEIVVVLTETVLGLARPAGGHLSFATLSPAGLGSAGFGTFGVLAVVAVLGFVGFEFGAGLSEEARSPRRTIPAATYLALGMIAVVYAGASWAMAAHAGAGHVVAAAGQQGPGLLFGLGGSGGLSQAAQLLFLTSLFAAALAFHNVVWRYVFALGRENVLPAALGRTGANNIPKAASLTQSATGLAVILLYAAGGWPPMTDLFFWLGTTGGFGIIVLLALTSAAVIAFFARDPRGENAWRRLVAPALAAVALAGIVVLAVQHYATLLGVGTGDPAAWALPASYPVVAVIGLGWGLILKIRRPRVYAAIGLGAHAATGQLAPASRRKQCEPAAREPLADPVTPTDVVTAGEADLDFLSQVIAGAFENLPPSRWGCFPTPATDREIFPGYFRLCLEHAMASGVVHTTPDRSAAALWIPAGPGAPGPPAEYDTRLAALTSHGAGRFRAFDATLDRRHPVGTPYHHLVILAVAPGRQNQGTGSALLRAHHQTLDRDGTPAYLEAASLNSRCVYLRHGYADHGPPVLLPGGPPMWPMWREPRPDLERDSAFRSPSRVSEDVHG